MSALAMSVSVVFSSARTALDVLREAGATRRRRAVGQEKGSVQAAWAGGRRSVCVRRGARAMKQAIDSHIGQTSASGDRRIMSSDSQLSPGDSNQPLQASHAAD
ncbi:hypothetical protein [Caballeronia sp. LZ065]|uniref:hypothetical protein n=1 Tax=Caballeronia sp. LZ065 TaxID=3038571 RepID=UPI00286CC953|nr:hypothetical protein [Caballeronia sp. LZ065]